MSRFVKNSRACSTSAEYTDQTGPALRFIFRRSSCFELRTDGDVLRVRQLERRTAGGGADQDGLGGGGASAERGIGGDGHLPRAEGQAEEGLPPTVGFYGKLVLFYAGVDAGLAWLVVVAGLNSALSLFYYFRIVKSLFLAQADDKSGDGEPGLGGLIAVLSVATIVVGLFSGPLQRWSDSGTESLGLPPLEESK